jgi:predicted membrane channel-forming protein YqfA (hemolysin III family)
MAVGPQLAAVAADRAGIRAAVISPPTWLGWIAVVAGVLYLLGVLIFVSDWFFILVGIGFLLTIIWYLAGGIWYLFMAPELAEEVAGGGALTE